MLINLMDRRLSVTGAVGRRQGPEPAAQFPAFVGRVFAASAIPSVPGRFVSVHPTTVLGAEGEGSLGSIAVDASTTILVYFLGPAAPALGDDLICRFVNDRWVAEKMSKRASQTVSLPTCLCQAIPSVLHMTSAIPTCNGGMFQSCVITYGDTPPALASLMLGAQCFLSTTSFTDPNGDQFRYHLQCRFGVFTLSRVYETSIFWSPFEDSVRYTWFLSAPGNTCSPFLLSNGQIYSGGDPTCRVTITP